MPSHASLYPVSRQHLDLLSDGIGILQHAIGRRPDPTHGYCTDDVARALEVDLLHQLELGWPAVLDRARVNLRYLEDAFDEETGRFRNFRRFDGTWLDAIGSEDCHGRAILALGSVIAMGPDGSMTAAAESLVERAMPATEALTALRAVASSILGLDLVIGAGRKGPIRVAYRRLARRLHAAFDTADAAWPWPESTLTYENAVLARALIVAGQRLRFAEMTSTGLRALDWLIDAQTAPRGHLSPIGNHWWPRGGVRSRFDQQPIETTALLRAAGTAHAATGLPLYRRAMEQAYAWYLGANDLGVTLVDPPRGAGCDGLTKYGPNTNQGAESTLMWLIALENIRALRHGAVRSPGVRATRAPSSAAFGGVVA